MCINKKQRYWLFCNAAENIVQVFLVEIFQKISLYIFNLQSFITPYFYTKMRFTLKNTPFIYFLLKNLNEASIF